MLIQTADRAHARATHEQRAFWPMRGVDEWWPAARRLPRGRARRLLALRMLEQWRKHATFQLSVPLQAGWLAWFLDETEGALEARVLDRLSVSALFAGSLYRRLRANYTGAALQAGGTDIALIGKTVDMASLVGLGGTQTVNTVYDQSGSGFADFAQTTAANRPRILNSGTLDATANGIPSMVFDGTNDHMAGPTASTYGLSGSTGPFNLFVCSKAAASTYHFGLGIGTTNHAFRFGLTGSSGAPQTIIDINAGTNRRTFTAIHDHFNNHCGFSASMAAGAQVGQSVCRQDGVDLAQAAVTGGTNTTSITSSITRWGCVNDSLGNPAGFFNGQSNCMLFFSAAVLANADLLAVEQELSRHI